MKENQEIILNRILSETTPPLLQGLESMGPDDFTLTEELRADASAALETVIDIASKNGVLLEKVFYEFAERERSGYSWEKRIEIADKAYRVHLKFAHLSEKLDDRKSECYFLSMAAAQAMYEIDFLPHPKNLEFSQKILKEIFIDAKFPEKYKNLINNED